MITSRIQSVLSLSSTTEQILVEDVDADADVGVDNNNNNESSIITNKWTVPCQSTKEIIPSSSSSESGGVQGQIQQQFECHRFVIDNFISIEEINQLRRITFKGMSYVDDNDSNSTDSDSTSDSTSTTSSASGGPTIMDINTGYIRNTNEVTSIYSNSSSEGNEKRKLKKRHAIRFTENDHELYQDVIDRIQKRITKEFLQLSSSSSSSSVYHTAPTFITRAVGSLEKSYNGDGDGDNTNGNGWIPKSDHDIYWSPHVDVNNTDHYHFSALLYLSNYEDDFTGGMFKFLDGPGFDEYDQSINTKPLCYDEDLISMGSPYSCTEYKNAGRCSIDDIKEYCPLSCQVCSTQKETKYSIENDNKEWNEFISSSNSTESNTNNGDENEKIITSIEPKRGRLVLFTSGTENLHVVRQVQTGTRIVISLWYTFDSNTKFIIKEEDIDSETDTENNIEEEL
ncbi:hypothetical protein FRACYDRAFT_249538 [Fragilariopsis cylindrus CCMP1102]|uniref:Prolyl 4-hydroxylase alpha subunit domain-containing protein n=1 Tax=Fragilariopsis cylindrus CCMP1102 TaxID=635003 RepID=A0A1E7ERZ3_9STRA|nr:hypothetical protein FRACYDRAFT_249538 [Fragilariopsis cylindrus CCMP1102]|eukprot:OEU08642.1 hypothetical protein FRACYDRAFT_249538 [Fragilariopsis cylindrus CCMP1102]